MAKLSVHRYSLPCSARLKHFFPHQVREGIFLAIHDDNAGISVGEFAPLRGIHRDSIDDICNANILCQGSLSDLVEQEHSVQGLRFMMSMAMLHHEWRDSFAMRTEDRSIALAALIDVTAFEQAIWMASGYVAQGYTCLKIKIGQLPICEEIQKIKTIAHMAPTGIKIRLDANKRYSLSEADELVSGLRRVSIEYYEELLADNRDVKKLHEQHGVALAVDESLTDRNQLADFKAAGVTHVIIKSSRFSSIFSAIKIANDAISLGMKPIFSHCYESEFSSTISALIIDKLNLLDDAHGIVVDGVFHRGVFKTPLRSFRGKLSLTTARERCYSSFL